MQKKSPELKVSSTPVITLGDPLPTPSRHDLWDRDVQRLFSVASDLYRVTSQLYVGDLKEIEQVIDDTKTALEIHENDCVEYLSTATRPASNRQIKEQIALLVAAFPNCSKVDAAFGRLLCEEVASLGPSIGSLEKACQKLRRTWKPEFGLFVPSIAEVLAEIDSATKNLKTRKQIFEDLPRYLEQACEIRHSRKRLLFERDERTKVQIRKAFAYAAWKEQNPSQSESLGRPPTMPIRPTWPEHLVEEVRRERSVRDNNAGGGAPPVSVVESDPASTQELLANCMPGRIFQVETEQFTPLDEPEEAGDDREQRGTNDNDED